MVGIKNKKTMVSVLFMELSIIFTVCLIASNILETKQMVFGPLHLTGGLLIFPISYIVNDVVCEVWGYRRASILIWTGFITNFCFMAIASLADAIPGAPYWDNEAGFHAIFGLTPRIALASFVSFIAGSFVNAYVMSRMKISDNGKRFPLRAVVSTLWGEGADSLCFFPLAFYGVLPDEELPLMMLSQMVLKTGYELIVLPVTIRVVRWVKAYEGEDVYDLGVSYNIFAVFRKSKLFFAALVTIVSLPALADSGLTDCPMVRIEPERLPDMVIPRCGHNIFYAGGELTVTGGHTTHFVPVATAEVFTDGRWRLLPMAYPHDNGFAVVLRSGEVLIGGGHSEELGVGQTYTLERYNPVAHTFEGFGCLDRRRVLANATQLADGCVIICGNHYANDAVGCYDGQPQVEHVKSLRQGRSNPYILPVAADDALILGANDIYDRRPDTVWVDRLKGDAFRVPLLEQWRLVYTDQPFTSTACAMADNSYLLMATNGGGQLGFVVVNDTTFSLLPTACPVPMKTQFGPVVYRGSVAVDRKRQRGYVAGADSLFRRQYILAVDYGQQPAALTLYYTDSLEHAAVAIPVLTPDGDLILAGGIPNNNYKPLSTVWLYRFATVPQSADTVASGATILWFVLALGVLTVFACVLYLYRKRKCMAPEQPSDQTPAQPTIQLMERIAQLLERDQRYLTRMKVSDVAVELGVSVSEVTECISQQHGCTFAQLMAAYRVRYAQQLLVAQPDMKLATLIAQSGFTSETTFFRSFKEVVGTSPKEWIESHKASHESTAET